MSNRTLTFYVDGELYEGTLDDYARARQLAHYEAVDVSSFVIDDKGRHRTPETFSSEYGADDMAYTTIRVKGYGEAGFAVDGRA